MFRLFVDQKENNVFVLDEATLKHIKVARVWNKNVEYLAHEKQDTSVATSFPTNSLFLVGPEGGFTDEEVQIALKNNFQVISLGKRILRAEIASLFIASRIN